MSSYTFILSSTFFSSPVLTAAKQKRKQPTFFTVGPFSQTYFALCSYLQVAFHFCLQISHLQSGNLVSVSPSKILSWFLLSELFFKTSAFSSLWLILGRILLYLISVMIHQNKWHCINIIRMGLETLMPFSAFRKKCTWSQWNSMFWRCSEYLEYTATRILMQHIHIPNFNQPFIV